MLIIFVGGHKIQSFAAPIAIVESLSPRRAHRPWLGAGGLIVMVVLLAVYGSMPTTWLGVAGQLELLGTLATLVWRWSRSTYWGHPHVLAVAAAPLLVNAAMAFTIEPLGSGPALTRYASNAVLAFGVVVLVLYAARGTLARAQGTEPVSSVP